MNSPKSSSVQHDTVRVALRTLGLTDCVDASDVRAAFRSRVVALHPDITGAVGNEPTLALLDAYRVALEHAESTEATKAANATEAERTAVKSLPDEARVWLVDHNTIALRCSREEAFIRVLEVGHSLGSITYLDREGELLEVLLRTKLGDNVSLVISFQGRSDWVEAFLTSEVLDVAKHELPTTAQLTELYAHQLTVRW